MLSKLKFTKKDLLKLPHRQLGDKNYCGILVCKKGKHSSNYASMLIVGLYDYDSLENARIVSKTCDSIQWENDDNFHFASDMHFQSGIIHFFSQDASFETIGDGSTLFIYLIKNNNNDCYDCKIPF
jgi:hypothetical protein